MNEIIEGIILENSSKYHEDTITLDKEQVDEISRLIEKYCFKKTEEAISEESTNLQRGRPTSLYEPIQHLVHKLMMSSKAEGFQSFTRIDKICNIKSQYGDMQIVEDEVWEISVKKRS